MVLLARKKVIQCVLETTKGTKIAGTQAIRVFDPIIKPTSTFEERRGNGTRIGIEDAGVLSERSGQLTFSSELCATGTNGLEAGLAILLQCCGFLKSSESYTFPTSSTANQKTASFDVYEDGVKKGLAGAMGTLEITAETGKRCMLNFEFSGIWQTPTDSALPSESVSGKTPMLFQGGSFKIGSATKKISRLTLNCGQTLVPEWDPNATGGISTYLITDATPEISFDLEAETVASYDINGIWLAGTTAAIEFSLTDGSDTITFSLPKVRYKDIPEGDRDGILTYDAVGEVINNAGDNAITVTVT
jgi:hypothetical protein